MPVLPTGRRSCSLKYVSYPNWLPNLQCLIHSNIDHKLVSCFLKFTPCFTAFKLIIKFNPDSNPGNYICEARSAFIFSRIKRLNLLISNKGIWFSCICIWDGSDVEKKQMYQIRDHAMDNYKVVRLQKVISGSINRISWRLFFSDQDLINPITINVHYFNNVVIISELVSNLG